MKALLLSIICVLTLSVGLNAQEPVSFEKVIQADSIGKSELYLQINSWIVEYYKSANAVIQMSDQEAGIFMVKGNSEYKGLAPFGKSSYDGRVSHTVTIYIKDGRFKVIVSNFVHSSDYKGYSLGLITSAKIHSTNGMFKKLNNDSWNDLKTKSKKDAERIFNSITQKTKEASFNDDSW